MVMPMVPVAILIKQLRNVEWSFTIGDNKDHKTFLKIKGIVHLVKTRCLHLCALWLSILIKTTSIECIQSTIFYRM